MPSYRGYLYNQRRETGPWLGLICLLVASWWRLHELLRCLISGWPELGETNPSCVFPTAPVANWWGEPQKYCRWDSRAAEQCWAVLSLLVWALLGLEAKRRTPRKTRWLVVPRGGGHWVGRSRALESPWGWTQVGGDGEYCPQRHPFAESGF